MIAVEANPSSGFVGCVSVPSSSVRFPTQEAATTAVQPRHSNVSNCNLHHSVRTLRRISDRIASSSSNLSAYLHLLPAEHDHKPTEIYFSTVLPYIAPFQSFSPFAQSSSTLDLRVFPTLPMQPAAAYNSRLTKSTPAALLSHL
jgi:hypothetical protein